MALTARQERFCQEYALDLNASQAAVRAGYSKRSAQVTSSRMLANHSVAARIAELKKVREVKTGITQGWVLSRLVKVAERCLQEEPVLDREGSQTGVFRFDAGNAIKALALLGQHVGLFEKLGEDACPPVQALEHFRALLRMGDAASRN